MGDAQDSFQSSGRAFKQARRGGRGGRDDMRGRQLPPGANLPLRPDMPPFDPNNPIEMFLQLQAMGLPYPPMPKFPTNFNGGRNQQRRKGRCRDFDNKGFCSRGSTCPYDHGNESIFVPQMGASGEGEFVKYHFKSQVMTFPGLSTNAGLTCDMLDSATPLLVLP